MFNMIHNLFSLVFNIFKLVIWILKISWKLVIVLTFLQWFYLCILQIHKMCKFIVHFKKKKDKKTTQVIQNVQQYVYESSFNFSTYEDDIHPEDSVSVISANSSKDSDGSHFENIDSNQVISI